MEADPPFYPAKMLMTPPRAYRRAFAEGRLRPAVRDEAGGVYRSGFSVSFSQLGDCQAERCRKSGFL